MCRPNVRFVLETIWRNRERESERKPRRSELEMGERTDGFNQREKRSQVHPSTPLLIHSVNSNEGDGGDLDR